MLVRLFALLAVCLSLFAATPAYAQSAQKIGVVDFQSALEQVKEGVAARTKLESMFKEKKAAIDQMETRLRALKDSYDKQAMLLSDDARKAKENELMQANAAYQQAYAQSEGEMQQLYGQLMEGLISKMQTITQTIGKEKGYTLIFEKNEGGVVFSVDAIDLTAELVKRYDAANGG